MWTKFHVVLCVIVSLIFAPFLRAQSPGEIIITEFMADPDSVTDANGEYFELYNATTNPIDINGDTLLDDGVNHHLIDNGGSLIIPPKDFIVLSRKADPLGNGSFSPDYVYASFTLGNSGDEIVLKTSSGVEIARCNYDRSTAGKSSELIDISSGTDGLTTQDDYTPSNTLMSNGDYGSPGSAGGTAGIIQSTAVAFSSSSASVSEGDGTFDVTVTINNPDAANATYADVVLVSGDDTDIGGYTTQHLTFPAGSATNQTISLLLLDDTSPEDSEILMFELQNVSGGDNAIVGSPNQFNITILDNDLPDLIINEINADPGADANGDSAIDGNDDEFVEIINNSSSIVDLSGYTVSDGIGVKHTFSTDAIIYGGQSILIFAGGAPTGEFGKSLVELTTDLGLNNTGDEVILKNSSGITIDSVKYGSEGGDEQSLTRDPDVTGNFVRHSEATGSGEAIQSPGARIDGSPFDGAPDYGATRTVSSDTTLNYPPGVAVQLSLGGTSGYGPMTAQLYMTIPENISGIPEQHVSTYRWVISNPSGVTFDQTSEARFLLDELPNSGWIMDGNRVQIYHREIPGTGAFTRVETSYDENSNTLVASSLASFGEFVFASTDQPLPVTLSSFTAEITAAGVTLRWTTESEIKNQGFILERSENEGKQYQVISDYKSNPALKGAGSTPNRSKYSFDVATVKIGETYQYRLSDVSYDGTVTAHNDRTLTIRVTAVIPEKKLQYDLLPAYPNPFNSTTNISYSIANDEQVRIELFDLRGRSVMTLFDEVRPAGKYQLFLNLPNFPSGIYFVHLSTPSFRKTQQVVLLK